MAHADTMQLSDATFPKEVLDEASPVLVDFWAPWCGPCRRFAPTVDAIASEYLGRVKVGTLNVDENPEAAGAYDVQTIPTLLLFHRGKIVDRLVGSAPQAVLDAMLRRRLASEEARVRAA